MEFVGVKNYIHVLTNWNFWRFLGNTLLFVSSSVLLGLLLQMGIALALNTGVKFERVWQVLILIPWAIPWVLSASFWKWMLHSHWGVANYLLTKSGLIDQPIFFLGEKWTALGAIIVTDIWVWTPLAVVILLAGLKGIPSGLYEAARVDGANAWQLLRYITIPFLRPALLVVLLTRTVFAIRQFGEVWALTKGGPGRATEVLSINIYKHLIRYGNVGYSSAVGVLLVIITMIVVFVIFKVVRPKYEL